MRKETDMVLYGDVWRKRYLLVFSSHIWQGDDMIGNVRAKNLIRCTCDTLGDVYDSANCQVN